MRSHHDCGRGILSGSTTLRLNWHCQSTYATFAIFFFVRSLRYLFILHKICLMSLLFAMKRLQIVIKSTSIQIERSKLLVIGVQCTLMTEIDYRSEQSVQLTAAVVKCKEQQDKRMMKIRRKERIKMRNNRDLPSNRYVRCSLLSLCCWKSFFFHHSINRTRLIYPTLAVFAPNRV